MVADLCVRGSSPRIVKRGEGNTQSGKPHAARPQTHHQLDAEHCRQQRASIPLLYLFSCYNRPFPAISSPRFSGRSIRGHPMTVLFIAEALSLLEHLLVPSLHFPHLLLVSVQTFHSRLFHFCPSFLSSVLCSFSGPDKLFGAHS